MNARTRCLFLSLVFVVFGLAALPAPWLSAQQPDPKKEAQLRTVHGVTMDKTENPVASAVVFLKNTRSNAIRSYISDEQGNYRFSGLDPNTDYEVHAEKDGAQSQTRTISSFDSKKEIVVNLKLDKKKA
jgi:Carboxypeptidase regulatory-like domain